MINSSPNYDNNRSRKGGLVLEMRGENSAERPLRDRSLEDGANFSASFPSSKDVSTKRLHLNLEKVVTDKKEGKSPDIKPLPKIVFTKSYDTNDSPTKNKDSVREFRRPVNLNQQQSEDGLGVIQEESTIINTPNFVINQGRGKLALSKASSDTGFNRAVRDKQIMSPTKLTKTIEQLKQQKLEPVKYKSNSNHEGEVENLVTEENLLQVAKGGLKNVSSSLSRASDSSVGSHKQSARQKLKGVITQKFESKPIKPLKIITKPGLLNEKSMSSISGDSTHRVNPEQIYDKFQNAVTEQRRPSQNKLLDQFISRMHTQHPPSRAKTSVEKASQGSPAPTKSPSGVKSTFSSKNVR